MTMMKAFRRDSLPEDTKFNEWGFPILTDAPESGPVLGPQAGAAAGRPAATLAQLMGEPEEIPGHPGFYTKSPTGRQEVALTALIEKQGREDAARAAQGTPKDTSERLMDAATIAALAVYRQDEAGALRQATLDEMLDNFRSQDYADLIQRVLGLTVNADPEEAGSGQSPNVTEAAESSENPTRKPTRKRSAS